jgi:catechol 2,3-dioxygenase-like lactoylglutathione lyase family enzyme
MKTHVNFSTSDLDRSVAFYRTLLNCVPAKHYPDYALFISEDPPLELALQADAATEGLHDAHYGVAVDTAQAVDDAALRLQSAQLPSEIEREETCCYAVQTKVWTRDPDGRRWEIYTVHDEVEAASPARCC